MRSKGRCADADGCAVQVVINSITATTRRRALLQSSISVDLSVLTDTAASATALAASDKLSLAALNQKLSAAGVAEITAITKAATPATQDPDDSKSSSSRSTLNACLLACALVVATSALQR
jgi:hypothetical protein